MYVAIVDFKDLRDGGYEYKAGDAYPREGLEVSPERLLMLSAPTPMRGPLITEDTPAPVEEQEQEVIEEPVEEPAPIAEQEEEPALKKEAKSKSSKNK